MSNFIPKPVYPYAIDNNKTLFLVFNSSQSVITENNTAWSQEITFKPVDKDKDDIWAESGFANLSGELFYYSEVDKNEFGKIYRFKKCIRNLAGEKTKFNKAGTDIRGFVVAEHHNQLVDCVLKMEEFIGESFSVDIETLDYRIRNLFNLPIIFDDYNCPEVNFTFLTLEENPSSGNLVSYNIEIIGPYTSFRLDFGDGQFESSLTSGTHRYAPNSVIDPVLSITNNDCTIIQTPIERLEPREVVNSDVAEPFEIPLPFIPDIPEIIFPEFVAPQNKYNLPPITFPCISLGSLNDIIVPSLILVSPPIPSVITIAGVNIPSIIAFVDPPVIPPTIEITGSIPDVQFGTPPPIGPIMFSSISIPTLIELIGMCEIPTLISIDYVEIPTLISIDYVEIPTLISIDYVQWNSVITLDYVEWNSVITLDYVPLPEVISFANLPAIPDIISFDTAPVISVDWGTPPPITCIVTVECPGASMAALMQARESMSEFQDSFSQDDMVLEVQQLGIPTEIKLVVPEIPDLRIVHDIPVMIDVNVPEIPDIKVVVSDDFPREINITHDIPDAINIESNIPNKIVIEHNIPKSMVLEIPENFPTSIKLEIESPISVIGIPDTITVTGIPTEISLIMPENPVVDMVYNGPAIPVDVKIQLDVSKLTDDKGQCVKIIPCNPN